MRECGEKVAAQLERVVKDRGVPLSIAEDNGSEFASRAMDAWAYGHGIRLDFIRPGNPVENGYIESFNGRLRDCGKEIYQHLSGALGDGHFLKRRPLISDPQFLAPDIVYLRHTLTSLEGLQTCQTKSGSKHLKTAGK